MSNSQIDRTSRYQGCLLGLALGDALGTTLEFTTRGSFKPITDLIGGGPFGLRPGQWTDDTSMALCLTESLLEKQGFDAYDQMQRYNRWRLEGYLSSNGRCFDIGLTVSEAISQFLRTDNPFSGSTNPMSAGNGSLMRLSPVVMYFSPDLDLAIHYAGESSRTTHGAVECIDACCYFASLLHFAFAGESKAQLLSNQYVTPRSKKVKAIQQGCYQDKTYDQISGSGYVIDCLEAALWCFANTDNYQAAVLAAANLGDDADTTAAVCGQIAGAYYGVEGLPESWLAQLTMKSEIEQWATSLCHSDVKSHSAAY